MLQRIVNKIKREVREFLASVLNHKMMRFPVLTRPLLYAKHLSTGYMDTHVI